MERWLGSPILAMLIATSSFAAGPRPQAVKFDHTISIDVENVTLGRLLQLWDQATGMRSTVPKDLSTLPVSISFSGLNVNDAVQKIFEKLQLDYVFIEAQGIIVTGASQPGAVVESATAEEEAVIPAADQTGEQEPPQPQPPQPPPMLYTPFGLIPKAYASGVVYLPPVPGEPWFPFFAPQRPVMPPAGAANGPVYNDLFAPISIYQDPGLPPVFPPR
jgi:hypothetical protein